MGLDPISMAAIASAGAGIYGAHSQSQANSANLAAQQQQQHMMQGLVQQLMQPQQNPYAAMMGQMLGQMRPPGQPQQGYAPFTGPMVNSIGDPRVAQQVPLGQETAVGVPGGMQVQYSRQAPADTGPAFAGPMGVAQWHTQQRAARQAVPQQGAPQFQIPQSGPGLQQQAPQMWQYQNQNPFTYNPQTVGQLPQSQAINVANPNQINLNDLLTPQIGAVPQAQAAHFDAPTAVTGTQGQNAGQDALLQMMRRDPGGGAASPFLTEQLQQLGRGDSSFDNSELFKALAPMDQRALDEQLAQMQGSRGSFSKLFSSRTDMAQRDLRERALQDTGLRNAQLQQQSFENAQGRRAPALAQLGGLEQFFAQQGLQQQGLNQQAAQAAGQLQLGGQQLDTQAAMANAANQLSANQGNAQFQQQAGQFNAANALQAMLAQAQMQQQTGMANQQMGYQTQAQNIANQMQTGQFNAQQGTQNNQFNAANALQALFANQNALNQGGQFNAQMGQQAASQNAQQGNIYNQLLMSMMGQANQMQMGQLGYNAQLAGILGGIGVPQQQQSPWPAAIGDAASTAMMVPFLQQMYQQNQQRPYGGQYGQSNYPYGMFGR